MSKKSKQKKVNKLYKKYMTFLDAHVVDGKGVYHTHTAFGHPWRKYNIPDTEYDKFIAMYSKLINKTKLHMIERPREVGPLLIDLDWRFKRKYKRRQYTLDDIKLIISKANEVLRRYYKCKKKQLLGFVLEKPKPTKDIKNDGRVEYKDGVHVVYPNMAISINMRYLITDEIKEEVRKVSGFDHIKSISNLDTIIDMCVIKSNGFVMYKSNKEGGQIYDLTHIYDYRLRDVDIEDDDYEEKELPYLFSNRKYKNDEESTRRFDKFDKKEIERKISIVLEKSGPKKKKTRTTKPKIAKSSKDKDRSNIWYEATPEDITLAKKLVKILNSKRASNFDSWIRVGWALHNTCEDNDMYKEWIKFSKRTKSGNFDADECMKVWANAHEQGLTIGSLRMWAGQDNPMEFAEILREHINEKFEEAEEGTHYDLANLLYELHKHTYKCTSKKNKTWYEFQDHRWVKVESGYTLRHKMSSELVVDFAKLNSNYWIQFGDTKLKPSDRDGFQKRANKIQKIVEHLKTSGFKNSVLTECEDLFYDPLFQERLDSKRHLIGFENGVYDLGVSSDAKGSFRHGLPEDYITLSTGYDYTEYSMNHEYIVGITKFCSELQQHEDMRNYIMTLLASYLDGYNKHQKFIIWTGIGCHAKGAKIRMIDGSVKNVEDIVVGDQLMGDDSTPRNVLELFRGNEKMYKIVPKKGASYTVNANHRLALKFIGYSCISWQKKYNSWRYLWCEIENNKIKMKQKSFKVRKNDDKDDIYKNVCVFKTNNEKINQLFLKRVTILPMKVKKYVKLSSHIRKLFLGFRCPIEFNEKNVGLDPWVLGYWLGDGLKDSPRFVTADEEVVNYHKDFAEKHGLILREYVKYQYSITHGKGYAKHNNNHFTNMLRKYKIINDKYVPHDYKCNSREIRLQILAGMLDADGYYNNNGSSNHFELTLKSEKMLDDFIFIARSLGFAAYKSECKKTCTNGKNGPVTGTYYRTIISGNGLEEIPTKIKRKQAVKRKCKRDNLLVSIKAVDVGEGDYYGFHVDGNECYLLEDCTASFNSNGKSTLVDFFTYAFGNYCGVLPTSVLTRKKGAAGSATPEMAFLRGKRFVIIQEPEGDDKIHVGYMKELTGGDRLYVRPLYMEPYYYTPQFKMILICNKLPHIPSTDGGTWRRIRVAPWNSEFLDLDDNGKHWFTHEKLKSHQFPKDIDLCDKLKEWKKAFMWLLLNKYYEKYKRGNYKIKEPDTVTQHTREYQKSSDRIYEYISDTIIETKKSKDTVSCNILYGMFRSWYRTSYSKTGAPSRKDFKVYLEKHGYKLDRNDIIGYKLAEDDDDDYDDDE